MQHGIYPGQNLCKNDLLKGHYIEYDDRFVFKSTSIEYSVPDGT